MRRWQFTAVLFGLTLVVVPAAAGCGPVKSSAGGASHVTVTEAMAYTATMKENSADFYEIFDMTTGNHAFGATTTESGPVNWSTDQGEVATMTTAESETFSAREIFDGRKTYSKMSIKGLPASTLNALPELAGWKETTWTGSPSSDLSGILPTLLLGGFGNPAGTASPATLLGLLRAQASSVQNFGDEVLDGVDTTHYRALIPLSRMGAGTAAQLRQAEQELGTNALSFDYWVDSANLLRQLRFAISIPEQPAASGGTDITPQGIYPLTISVSLQLSAYGTPVHVVPPPPGQITSHSTCVVGKDGFNCSS